MPVIKYLHIILVLLFLLSGCFGGGTAVPQDHYYRLPHNMPTEALQAHTFKSEVAVAAFESFGLQRERPLVYIDINYPLEVKRYHYHHWAASPPQLLQENLLHYLRKIRFAPRIIRYMPGKQSDTIIKGRLLQFERLTGTDKPRVKVSLELGLYIKEQIHVYKTYSRTMPVDSYAMHDTIAAFARALQEIYHNFVIDLGHSSSRQAKTAVP